FLPRLEVDPNLDCGTGPMHSMDESPLSRFASSLSPSSTRFASDHGVVREFPMYTLPVETVLQLKKLLPHEEAWELESPLKPLQAFREEMGRAIFVSHQWLSAKHPDPHSEQLRILQATLGNLLSGAARVSLQPLVELARGRGGCPSTTHFACQPLFVWYDFFSCPQGLGGSGTDESQSSCHAVI
ncbi:unnamed protein product, partial [Durusdinium trenchii]